MRESNYRAREQVLLSETRTGWEMARRTARDVIDVDAELELQVLTFVCLHMYQWSSSLLCHHSQTDRGLLAPIMRGCRRHAGEANAAKARKLPETSSWSSFCPTRMATQTQ